LLQAEAVLDPKKTNVHVDNLRKGKFRLVHFGRLHGWKSA
jgi:hypothetical protein